jgi:tetratricopeptide (TPR) repeat protein
MYDTSRWAEALGYYRRALENGAQNPNVLTDAGICCQQLRQFDEALEYFRRANEADPSHWQSLYNTAVVAGLDLGRFDAADEAISKLLKVNPAAPGLDGLRQNVARAKASQGKPS